MSNQDMIEADAELAMEEESNDDLLRPLIEKRSYPGFSNSTSSK